ncbi:MAG: hypothetical protein ACO25B_08145 [Chitinophagaceae bacterium]
MPISIVIIVSKNDATGTERTLDSIHSLGADIVLYDISKTEFAETAARRYGARLYKGEWDGYDQVRYKASVTARFDWILMLHTGEEADELLRHSIRNLDLTPRKLAYRIRFKNCYENRWLGHGEWGGYYHLRLANRSMIRMPDRKINEGMIRSQGIPVKRLPGNILHTIIPDHKTLQEKLSRDARCVALRNYRHGLQVTFFRQLLSPLAAFVQQYFFKRGFLDGWQGFDCAKLGAWYTYMKYSYLRRLNHSLKRYPETPKYAK